jgi:hypothetical protein
MNAGNILIENVCNYEKADISYQPTTFDLSVSPAL